MPDEIWDARYLGRSPAWHKWGNVIPAGEKITATEALKRNRLDYVVGKYSLDAHGIGEDGKVFNVPFPGEFGILRHPTEDDPYYRPWGVVGRYYVPLQNTTIAECLDVLTPVYPVETCGAVEMGRKVFFALDAGMCNIHGEEVHEYFTITDDKGGGHSIRMYYTTVVTVCKNTMAIGWAKASVAVNLNHYQSAGADMRFRMELIGKMNKAKVETTAMFTRMAEVALSAQSVKRVVEFAYPYPPMPRRAQLHEDVGDSEAFAQFSEIIQQSKDVKEKWEWSKTRVDAYREDVMQRFELINVERPDIAGTAWGVLNAVVESADYRPGEKSVAVSAMFGPRAKEKALAFTALLDEI